MKRWEFTSAGFVGFYFIFTRTFTSFSDISLDYRLWLAASCAATLLALLVLNKRLGRYERQLIALSTVLLFLGLCFQMLAIGGNGFFGFDLVSTDMATLSSIVFGIGYAIYWNLWIRALQKHSVTRIFVSVAAGIALSVCVTNIPILLFRGFAWGSMFLFVIRLALLGFTAFCLTCELRRETEQSFVPVSPEKRRALFNYLILTVAVYSVAWFVLNIGQNDRGQNASQGAWFMVLATFLVGATIIALSFRFGKNTYFTNLLCDILIIFSLCLYVVFALAGKDQLNALWLIVLIANPLLDIVVMGKVSSIRPCFGIDGSRIACIVLLPKEAFSLVGLTLHIAFPTVDFALPCIVILLLALLVAIGYLIHNVLGALSDASSRSVDAEDEFIKAICDEYGLTTREADVLRILIRGKTYSSISRQLFISESTVKTHVRHIYQKADVVSRDELIARYENFKNS